MRSKNSFLTMITGLGAMLVIGILGLIKIRFFIGGLGSEANGLIQMIYRILSYLSLAELGLGGALIYKLYKPLAESDDKQTSKILNTATYYFRRVGIVILAFLIIFMFILPIIIKNNTYNNEYLYILFILAGLPYAIEYLWYKKYYILLLADQKQYIVNIIFNTSTIIYDVCIILALTQNVTLIQYVLISYPFTLLKGIILQKIYKKRYSYLKESKEIDRDSVELSKDVFVHNIGSSINNSSDQIVLSIFEGLAFVSIYSSYIYISNYLKGITNNILRSTSHSFGNLFADEKERNKRAYDIFREYLSFASLLSIIITTTFFFSVIPFINYWINDPHYVLGLGGIIAFSLLIYTNIINIPANIASSGTGIFKQTKYYSFFATIVNITLSILLIKKYGIAGIVGATVISTLCVFLPLLLKVIYRDVFVEHKKSDYYIHILKSLAIITILSIITKICNFGQFYTSGIVNWLVVTSIYFIVILLICFGFYYLTDKFFVKFIDRCKELIKRRKKR